LATLLVEQGLAACVNILPRVESVYRWQGRVETGTEQLLLIKARAERFAELEGALRAQHPYELPELIAVPIERGASAYLDWMESALK
jgi:periplasmic divalent cation tolerance protein